MRHRLDDEVLLTQRPDVRRHPVDEHAHLEVQAEQREQRRQDVEHDPLLRRHCSTACGIAGNQLALRQERRRRHDDDGDDSNDANSRRIRTERNCLGGCLEFASLALPPGSDVRQRCLAFGQIANSMLSSATATCLVDQLSGR